MRIVTLILLLLSASASQAVTLYACSGSAGGNQLFRGFYVTNYPGSTLDTVTLTYSANTSGAYTVSLTPRLGAYDGPIVGPTQTNVVNIVGGTVNSTFNFGNVAVPTGSTLTFSQVLVAGPGAPPVLFYSTATGACPGVTQTDGTTPPLDVFRNPGVAVTITGAAAGAVVFGPALPIPTLSFPAIGLLGAMLAFLGIAWGRRRRRA